MPSLKEFRKEIIIGVLAISAWAVAVGGFGWSIVRDTIYPKPPVGASQPIPTCSPQTDASPPPCLHPTETAVVPAVVESPPALRQQVAVDLTPLYWSLRQIESSAGRWLIGTDGASYGPYGITGDFWREGCEKLGLDWNYAEWVNDPDRCEYVMYGYWQRHCPDALARGDFEKLTYTFRGWRDVEYWARVRNLMGVYGS